MKKSDRSGRIHSSEIDYWQALRRNKEYAKDYEFYLSHPHPVFIDDQNKRQRRYAISDKMKKAGIDIPIDPKIIPNKISKLLSGKTFRSAVTFKLIEKGKHSKGVVLSPLKTNRYLSVEVDITVSGNTEKWSALNVKGWNYHTLQKNGKSTIRKKAANR